MGAASAARTAGSTGGSEADTAGVEAAFEELARQRPTAFVRGEMRAAAGGATESQRTAITGDAALRRSVAETDGVTAIDTEFPGALGAEHARDLGVVQLMADHLDIVFDEKTADHSVLPVETMAEGGEALREASEETSGVAVWCAARPRRSHADQPGASLPCLCPCNLSPAWCQRRTLLWL